MSEPIIIGPIGVLGAVIGSVATIAAQFAASHIDKKMREQREQPQLEMLDEMLRHEEHNGAHLLCSCMLLEPTKKQQNDYYSRLALERRKTGSLSGDFVRETLFQERRMMRSALLLRTSGGITFISH